MHPKQAQLATATVTTSESQTELSTDALVKPSGTTAALPVPKEALWARELRERAAKLGLRWRIVCTSTEDEESYMGYAEPMSVPQSAQYIEDGAKGEWIFAGAHSQYEAGRGLLQAMLSGYASDHWYPATHRPAPERKKKKQCLRTVEGGDWGERYQSECKDCGEDQ